MSLDAPGAGAAVIAACFENLRDVARNLAKHNIVSTQVVQIEIDTYQTAKGIARLLVAGVGSVNRSGDQPGAAQMLPDLSRFVGVGHGCPATRDIAIAVAIVCGNPRACEAGGGRRIITR